MTEILARVSKILLFCVCVVFLRQCFSFIFCWSTGPSPPFFVQGPEWMAHWIASCVLGRVAQNTNNRHHSGKRGLANARNAPATIKYRSGCFAHLAGAVCAVFVSEGACAAFLIRDLVAVNLLGAS